jgi:hypothetical protein
MNIAFLSSLAGHLMRNIDNDAVVYVVGQDGDVYPLTHDVKVVNVDNGTTAIVLEVNYDKPAPFLFKLT